MSRWTAAQRREITEAVNCSPAVCGPRPWSLRFVDGAVELCRNDRGQESLPEAVRRDRLVSCGAAAATLEIALRGRGLRTTLRLDPDHGTEVLARVTVDGGLLVTERERHLFAAVFLRHSYRRPFGEQPVNHDTCARIISEHGPDGHGVEETQVIRIDDDAGIAATARLLGYAAAALRADAGYQRDLAAWSQQESLGDFDTMPWALIRTSTRLPDQPTLVERLRRQTTLLVITSGDTRIDHLRAGVATQRVWLAAVVRGMVGSVHTQSLHLREVRAGLIEHLGLAGFPHVLMRLGHSAPMLTPPRPRRTGGWAAAR